MNDDRYYSQHGEDCVLWEFFKNEPAGFFVDVAILQSIRQECYVKTTHPKIKDHATNKDRHITVQLKQDERR